MRDCCYITRWASVLAAARRPRDPCAAVESLGAVLRGLAAGETSPKFDVLKHMVGASPPEDASVNVIVEPSLPTESRGDRYRDRRGSVRGAPFRQRPCQQCSFAAADTEVRAERLSPETLRTRLQSVVDKLDELRVSVQAPEHEPFDEGPGFYLLRLEPGRGVRVQQIQQRMDDLQLALGLEMDQALRTYQHRGAVVIEVPKADSERYPVFASDLWRKVPIDSDRLLIVVGEDIAGDPVTLDLSSPNSPHLLVAGMTGSGKSVALRRCYAGRAAIRGSGSRFLRWIQRHGASFPRRTTASSRSPRPTPQTMRASSSTKLSLRWNVDTA